MDFIFTFQLTLPFSYIFRPNKYHCPSPAGFSETWIYM